MASYLGVTLADFRAGYEIRTRDFQLGKLTRTPDYVGVLFGFSRFFDGGRHGLISFIAAHEGLNEGPNEGPRKTLMSMNSKARMIVRFVERLGSEALSSPGDVDIRKVILDSMKIGVELGDAKELTDMAHRFSEAAREAKKEQM